MFLSVHHYSKLLKKKLEKIKLNSLSIFTVALFFGVCVAVDGFNFFVVAFYDLRYVTCTTAADLYIFLLKILAGGL